MLTNILTEFIIFLSKSVRLLFKIKHVNKFWYFGKLEEIRILINNYIENCAGIYG